jgi:hypothetical protein
MAFFEYRVVEIEGDDEPQIRMFADGAGPPCTEQVGKKGWLVGWLIEPHNPDPLVQLVRRPMSASAIKKIADAATEYVARRPENERDGPPD